MEKIFFNDINKSSDKIFQITTPGIHVFYFKNKNGNLKFEIKESSAIVYIFGIYDLKNDEVINLETIQLHSAPSSKSHLLIKGVLADNASLKYTGKIQVPKGASQVNASLENKNLLISDKAKVTTSPVLEIIPHNVKCSHSATISPINADYIDYLAMRGIDGDTSKKLLIRGFLDEINIKLKDFKQKTT